MDGEDETRDRGTRIKSEGVPIPLSHLRGKFLSTRVYGPFLAQKCPPSSDRRVFRLLPSSQSTNRLCELLHLSTSNPMTGRLSYIPNIEPTDRCVHTTGLVRLRLKGGMEDESVHYNAGIWTNDNSNKTAVTVIVQGTDEELENPTIVYLSSAWLVFNKAGRPVSIYTIPARCKPLAIKPSSVDTKGKEEDHEDLGRLWCSFMGIPRSFEAVRNDLNIATGTWTVEICVAGKPFSVM